jgi:serine/threonine protein kinase/Tol biopolymer transport system component
VPVFTVLLHYRIIRPLGSGGMGEVYLAEDTRLKRQVALKILPPALAAAPDRRVRFEREAQTIAALNHPNIVTIHSVEAAGNTAFITFEYVDGRTLANVIPRGGLPLPRLLAAATQIADALAAAHRHGVVHRDLKPANVMVTTQDRVKVLDFGLAKLREPTALDAAALTTRGLTGEGTIVGTVAYMSPEQAEGRNVDERSDIFSFGVMLYEMATGERPFKGDTNVSMLSSILRDTPRSLTDVNPALPRDLALIVRRCLAKDPDRRYQSAKDLRNELEELQQSLDSGELSGAPPDHHHRPAHHWWPIAAGAMVVVGAIAAAAVMQLRTRSSAPLAPPNGMHTRLTQTAGVEMYPSISPDGKWVVYTGGASGNADLYLQSTTGKTAINLTSDSPADDLMPAFSPDGEQIAFRSEREGGGIFVMGRTGESVRRLTAGGFYPAWFPDGRRIVYSTEGPDGPENRTRYSELWTVGADGTDARRLMTEDGVQPRVSPHGKRIAYWTIPADPATKRFIESSGGANRDVWTVGVDGRGPVRVTTHEANDWNPVWSPDGGWLYFLSNRSGIMNLWRVAINEATGEIRGDPQPVTAPAQYVAHFALSADGRTGVYASTVTTSNIGRVPFDPRRGVVTGPPVSITAGTNDFFYIDISPDGRQIAATTSSRTREDLYIVTVADGSARQLTSDFARDRAPRWSPDGRSIYFYSDRAGRYAVWQVAADGSGLHELSNTRERYYPVVSHDGTRLAVVNPSTRQLYVYDARDTSKTPEQLPDYPDNGSGFPQPTDWSANGNALALVTIGSRRSLWAYLFDRRSYVRIAASTGGAAGTGQAKWLQDGKRVAFSNNGRLFVGDIKGASREVLSISGETLVYPRLDEANSQIFFLRTIADGDIWIVKF